MVYMVCIPLVAVYKRACVEKEHACAYSKTHDGCRLSEVCVRTCCRKDFGKFCELAVYPFYHGVECCLSAHKVRVLYIGQAVKERDCSMGLDHQPVVIGDEESALVLHVIDPILRKVLVRKGMCILNELVCRPDTYRAGCPNVTVP